MHENREISCTSWATPEQLCDALSACTKLKPVYRRLLKMTLEHSRIGPDNAVTGLQAIQNQMSGYPIGS